MKWFSVGLTILAAGLVVYKNPDLFSDRTLWTFEGRRPDPASLLFDDQIKRSASTFLFRGDIARTGHLDISQSSKLHKVFESPSLNMGRHTASKSSPAVDFGGIYLGSDLGAILATDFQGKLRWRFRASAGERGVHATPALDQDFVYIGAYNGNFYCLNKSDGNVHWVTHLGQAIGSSAVIFEGAIYVSVETSQPNGFMVKLDQGDGHLIWRSDAFGEQSHSSPALDPEKKLVFVGANNHIAFALDMMTGQLRWSQLLSGEIKSTPAVGNGLVYFTDRGGRLFALKETNGAPVWNLQLSPEKEKSEGSQSSPALLAEKSLLIVGARDGALYGLDSETGTVKWHTNNGVTNFKGSATITKDSDHPDQWLAWIECQSQQLCALNAESGRVVAQWPLSTHVSGEVRFLNGFAFVAGDPDFSLDKPGVLEVFGP